MRPAEELYKRLLEVVESNREECMALSDGDDCSKCSDALRGKSRGWGMCVGCYRVHRRKVMKRALVELCGDACSVCKLTYPYACYDFHHIDGKDDTPSVLLASGTVRKIADEISKCVLVCANCHRLVHEEQRNGA